MMQADRQGVTRYILCEGVRVRCWDDGAVVFSPGGAETMLLASAMIPFMASLLASDADLPGDRAVPDGYDEVVRTLLRQNAIKAVS